MIAAIKDGTSIDSFKDVENALAGKQAAGDYATKTEAQGYADAKDEAIAAAKKAGDDAQADVDALAGKVGEVPADKTVVQTLSLRLLTMIPRLRKIFRRTLTLLPS